MTITAGKIIIFNKNITSLNLQTNNKTDSLIIIWFQCSINLHTSTSSLLISSILEWISRSLEVNSSTFLVLHSDKQINNIKLKSINKGKAEEKDQIYNNRTRLLGLEIEEFSKYITRTTSENNCSETSSANNSSKFKAKFQRKKSCKNQYR